MSDAVDGFMAFASLAKSGDLVLDPEVVNDCAAACQHAILSLQEVRDAMAHQTARLPLGDFSCGDGLAEILSETTQQFVDRLGEHIECLKAIHDLVAAQAADHMTSDGATGAALARVSGSRGGW